MFILNVKKYMLLLQVFSTPRVGLELLSMRTVRDVLRTFYIDIGYNLKR